MQCCNSGVGNVLIYKVELNNRAKNDTYVSSWILKSVALLCCISIVPTLIGQFANKPTCSQSGHGLVNSQTSQLADSDFFKSWKDYTILYTLNLNLTLTISTI